MISLEYVSNFCHCLMLKIITDAKIMFFVCLKSYSDIFILKIVF